jgi:regulator of sigma E protease
MIEAITHNFFSFLLIFSIIVFIHEFGHYYVAKICGVKIEIFSIGFGKEIFGWTDKSGTRWKFAAFPLGGYVKMFGDSDPSSKPNQQKIKKFTEEEKRVSFYFQNVYKRIAIVAAGPLANFILAILLFIFIFMFEGKNKIMPIAGEVMDEMPAKLAGLKKDDQILSIDNNKVDSFADIQNQIFLSSSEIISVDVKRGDRLLNIKIKPKIQKSEDIFGDKIEKRFIGIVASDQYFVTEKLGFFVASKEAVFKTYDSSVQILRFLGQLIIGQRDVKDLGGVVKIAQYSGKSLTIGFFFTLFFMAAISINLGILNLLPIPVLDGGHIFFYIIEAVRKKPISPKNQEIFFKIGFTILISLMIATTFNDIQSILNK